MSAANDREKRQAIIDACRRMNALGINQGTSGNISLRHESGMLVTPTGVPYETIASLKGVQHLNKLDDTSALLLMDNEGSLDLHTIALP